MDAKPSNPAPVDPQEWSRRAKTNARLGYIFGAVAFAIFLIAVWKYRPL